LLPVGGKGVREAVLATARTGESKDAALLDGLADAFQPEQEAASHAPGRKTRMNHVQFGEGACEEARKYLDSYISNELADETKHEVQRHIDGCPACAAEAAARSQLRTRLKSAVKAQSVPPGLQARIREQIRSRRSGSWFAAGWFAPVWPRWAVAMAAGVVICAGVWLNYSRFRMPTLSDRPGQNAYIQRVSATLAPVLKVGLGDHIHCSVFRKYPQNPPTAEKMEADLGPAYKGLLPLVRAAVPDGYRVIMAHQCGYAGRKFIHLTFEKGGGLLSLVIARRNPGESLSGLSPSSEPSSIPIYQSAAERYQVAGFEAGNFLAYVVSGLESQANLQIAVALAPGVRDFLMKTQA
jgi:anti-sigma factor (TIGR02949 family)